MRYLKKLAVVLTALAAAAFCFPQGPAVDDFAVVRMPAILAADADAVVRLEEVHIQIENPSRARRSVRKVVTVLSREGRDAGAITIYYGKFQTVRNLKGRILDADGKVIRRMRSSDVKDFSAVSGLYTDARVRTAELYHDRYPYTVEFEYEIRLNGFLSPFQWFPQRPEEAVELSIFAITAPNEMEFQFHQQHLNIEPEVSQSRNARKWEWRIGMMPRQRVEPVGPSWRRQFPALVASSSKFEIDGHAGLSTTWNEFGSWYHSLSDGRDRLPAGAFATVRELTAGASSDREKVELLYEHLQQTTRYVSVQLGIGGWQPFDAIYVAERGYGDCKALTNYLYAMLKVAGIKSYPALIRSGPREPDIIVEAPGSQFNHVILFVPLEQDTVWLEATSQIMPFGHIGSANEDRFALVVKPDGGELVRTPRSTSEQNRQERSGTVTIDVSGNGRAEVSTRYTGLQKDHVRQALVQATHRDRENWIRDQLGIRAFRLISADFSEVEARKAEAAVPVQVDLPQYATRTGSRLFFRPNLMERWSGPPPEVDNRRHPVHLSMAFIDSDVIDYVLPAGYSVESIPHQVTLEVEFGSYHSSVTTLEDGVMRYERRLEIRENRLSADQYDAYRDFIRQVSASDNAQVVLVRA